MTCDWPIVRLGDYIDSCLGKMLDKKKNKGTEQFYLGNSDVRWGSFDLSKLSKMKFEENEHERYGIKKGDLIVCEGGEPGRCAIWQEALQNMKIQKALHRIRTKESLNNYYLYYWFLYSGQRGLLEPYFTGTTIKHLTGKALKELELPLPPLSYQKRTARILKSIDDKIQLNRQINQTLEQIAQALFKSWFVDFEPTRAKIAAKQSGQDPERAAMATISGKSIDQLAQLNPEQLEALKTTAALFPDALVDSELGEIPEGWGIKKIGDVCATTDYVANGSFKALKENVTLYDEKNEVLYVRTTDYNAGFSNRLKYTDMSSYKFLKKSMLFGRETIISNVGDVGTVFRAPAWLGLPMTLGSNAVSLISEKQNAYLFWLFRSQKGQYQLNGIVTGSAQLKFNKTNLRSLEILWPNKKTLDAFEFTEMKIYKKLNSLSKETEQLKKLRDTLLPTLLNGILKHT